MGFCRQEYWSGLPCLSPGDLPHPGVQPGAPGLQADSLLSEPPGKPQRACVPRETCVSDHSLRPKTQMVALDTVGASDSLCLPRNAPAPLRQPAPLEKDWVPDVSLLFPPWRQSAPDPAGPGEAARLDAYPNLLFPPTESTKTVLSGDTSHLLGQPSFLGDLSPRVLRLDTPAPLAVSSRLPHSPHFPTEWLVHPQPCQRAIPNLSLSQTGHAMP